MLDKRDRAIAFVFCRDLHLTSLCSGLFQKICLKEGEVWRKFFSRLSHKGCRLLSSSVLLRMFTKVSQMKQSLNLVTKFPVLQSKRGWREETLKSSFTNCLFVCFAVAVVVIIIFH